jgi:alpha/beta superfamily hydrolase
MPEVIFNGPEGRIEGRLHLSQNKSAPAALVLHPHPLHGGTMNNKVVYNIFHSFVRQGFSVLRINFRGVGRSQGSFDNGQGELADAATALDWLQLHTEGSTTYWISGFSFGAWIGIQLLMRRPEVQGFVAVSPPVNKYDFSFLSPCPAAGLVIQGDADSVVPEDAVAKMVSKLSKQRNTHVEYNMIPGADHYFRTRTDEMNEAIESYLAMRLHQGDNPKPSRLDRRRRQEKVEE